MSKLYQRIELIFKWRLLSNNDVSGYIKRMSSMGKIDEVKKDALLNLILTKLGEIEDEAESLKLSNGGSLNGGGGGIIGIKPTETHVLSNDIPSQRESIGTFDSIGFKCSICGKVLKTKLALSGHSRSHKTTTPKI